MNQHFVQTSERERMYLQYEVDNILAKKYPNYTFKLETTDYQTNYDGIVSIFNSNSILIQKWIVEVKLRNLIIKPEEQHLDPTREKEYFSLRIKENKFNSLVWNKKFLDNKYNFDHKIMWYNTCLNGAWMVDLLKYTRECGWNWKERTEKKYNLPNAPLVTVVNDYIDLNYATYQSPLRTNQLEGY